MDAHQRLVADVDARGRATRLLRQDGNGRIYYTFTRWQVQLLKDYVDETEKVVEEYNKEHHIDNSVLVNGRRQTNLGDAEKELPYF